MILGPDKTNRISNFEPRTTNTEPHNSNIERRISNTSRDQLDEQRTSNKQFGNSVTENIYNQQKSRFVVRSSKFESEFWKLFKFGIVGISAFLIQFILYFIFTRFLMPGLPRTLVYVLAMGYSMVENYTAHRLWTFSDHIVTKGSVWRYASVVALAAIINAVIFWFGHNIIQIYDLIVVIIAGLAVPFITYAGHRWYTFKR
ncbi:MAG: GtrA family protein [Patescibacteria group bacterium]|nr:GtrA family protein [Patescibacteria group bacterium]